MGEKMRMELTRGHIEIIPESEEDIAYLIDTIKVYQGASVACIPIFGTDRLARVEIFGTPAPPERYVSKVDPA